jgi:hypothetical protein
MASIISAGTTSGTSLNLSGDTSGVLQLASNGSTTAVTINTSQGVAVLNCLGVGNATPSTSGAGITFPASQSASTDANTLDDYEEGSWTPVVVSGSGTMTSYTSVGGYTKIGNLINLWGYFNITNGGNAGGEAQITLPFTPATSTSYRNGVGAGREDNLSGFMTQIYNQAGSTRADMVTTAGNAITWTTGNGYLFTLQYPV